MHILISGSLAYDYIMDFPDSFKNHILPDQIHILNVCFVVDTLEKNLGGCAGNIGYTMKLLDADPIIFSPLGKDAIDYLEYFKKLGLNTNYIPISKNKNTSSAHITTDKDDNQIIAYYNGAGDEATDMNVKDIKEKIDFAIISPTKKESMIKHAKECFDLQIPFCFDPSHQLPAFTPQELMATIGQAKFYIANDYELKLTEEKTGWSKEELLDHVEVLITTLGEKGSVIATKDQIFEIKPCPPDSIEDPTGAGDAYRAGFFTAYTRGLDYQTCGQVGSVASTYAIEHYGTQNHTFTLKEFSDRYKNTYEETIDLKM
ncbi:MAG: carbohydrate kinase family protein [Candidatus Magasanikbacteria bacterium CG_4_10_14_0_2_um_filter_37_12]|uniref:Carbohydrate kinase family protein n=1 Tax=Candidatus Magasanikbacteria bacterium CG_4_10_14_0_2_um_filter_37_12 TaxID=1974637 RepID=A0A2M7V766_9BACT|nr:MAG: carbohydrate kinase family protein [Candidatus Magasanikbacteria bacterium CG_4_10_14_0_2_um_filter_37_12]